MRLSPLSSSAHLPEALAALGRMPRRERPHHTIIGEARSDLQMKIARLPR
jgi:hypothetical protein